MNELRRIRKEQNISANKLSKMCGVTRQHISAIEYGKINPSVNLAKKLADILHCEWTVFFDDKS